MKPLNIDKTGCSNMSSNCVVWQGPDIECINLCKGDSVTEVVYKLALELCNLMETFDLKNYDLKCFSSGVCQPQTFQDFINILINKVCALQACNPECGDSCNPCTTPPVTFATMQASGGSDTYVPIAKEFQFTNNSTGDTVTTLKVSDYAQAIGQKVSSLIISTRTIQNTLNDHTARLAALENAPAPTFEMPTVTPVGVLPKVATSMQLVLAATEQQFVQLKNAIGDSNNVLSNLQKLDLSISDSKSFSRPGTNVSGLRGYNPQPATFADMFGNMLVILSDIRIGFNNLMTNYIPSVCEQISLDLTATLNGGSLVLYVTGKAPASGFINTSGVGTVFTITDGTGNSLSYTIDIFSILNVPTGYTIDISGTRLNASTNMIISANPSFIHTATNSTCKSSLQYTLVNIGTCPSVIYFPLENEISFNFNTSGGTQAYTVKLFDESGINIISSQTFVSNAIQGITGKFTGLKARTLYKARVEIVINGVTTPCEFTSITTL